MLVAAAVVVVVPAVMWRAAAAAIANRVVLAGRLWRMGRVVFVWACWVCISGLLPVWCWIYGFSDGRVFSLTGGVYLGLPGVGARGPDVGGVALWS